MYEGGFETFRSCSEGVHSLVAFISGRLKECNAAYNRFDCKSSDSMWISV